MSTRRSDKEEEQSSRREFLLKSAKAAAVVTLPTLPVFAIGRTHVPTSKRPNVLFIMSDDMRVELGSYGSRFHAQTPNLDALARHGVRFDRDYCQFPLCNPSRASLLTGQRPLSTNVLGNRTDFRTSHPDYVSLPQLFRENGYVTPRTGKIFHGGIDDPKAWSEVIGPVGPSMVGPSPEQHNLGKTKVLEHGSVPPQPGDVLQVLPLDRQQSVHSDRAVVLDGDGEGHPENLVAEHTIELLRKYKDQPFFIGCGFSAPHSPPTAPQRFYDLYDPHKIELPEDFSAWPTVPPGFPRAAIRMRNADLFIGRGASREEAREVIRAYLAAISWADWNVGRVLAELDRLGLRDSTIVVFVADHGYQLGEKGKWSKAGSLFEYGTRVPLIINAPHRLGNGRAVYDPVQSLDIYPTLVELAGLKAPAQELQGHSLVPLLDHPTAPWNYPAFSIWSEDGKTVHGTAVRTRDWRYVEFGEHAANGAMLFDEHRDPNELKNLADDPAYVRVRSMLSKLIEEYGQGKRA